MANFDTPRRLDSWCGLSLPLARTQCRDQLRNGKCGNSCCSTSASLDSTGTIPGLAGCASAVPAPSCSKTNQHFGFTWSRLHPCRRTSYQPIHTTSTFELKSVASELVKDRSTSTAERDDIASSAHLSDRENRPLQSSVLGCNLKITRHVDTISCAEANCCIDSRRELMSCGSPELHSRSSGFSTQAVGPTLLTYRCRKPRIDQEIIGVGNGFLFHYRIHPLCIVGKYLTTFIGLYQHSSDRCFRPRALGWRNRSCQRCSFLPFPPFLHPLASRDP